MILLTIQTPHTTQITSNIPMAPFRQTTSTTQDTQQLINPVRLELANNNTEAFIKIQMPQAFHHPSTAYDAMDQLRYAIMDAATIINNPNANVHVHCIALNQQLTTVYNINTPNHHIGNRPSYEQLVRITRITTTELATQMLQPHRINLHFHSIYYHVSM